MDNEIIKAIEAIIKRGNDAEIRRKGDGYIVLEVKKTIKYSTSAQEGTGKGNRSQLVSISYRLALFLSGGNAWLTAKSPF